jgi:hypothetical protein
MAERLVSYARRQLEDVDRLILLMAVEAANNIPMVADLSAAMKLEMADWLRRVMTTAFELVAADESLDALGPVIEQMARRRQAQGIERAQTLRIYEVVQQTLLDDLTRRLRGHPREAELFPQVTRRLLELQRVITTWVTIGYAGSGGPPSQDRNAQIQTLLEIRAGRRTPDPEDRDLARRLGLSLPLREVTVSAQLGPLLDEVVRSTARANPWGVVGSLDGRMVSLTVRAPHSFTDPSGTATLPEGARPEAVDSAVLAAGQAADVASALGTSRLNVTQAAPLSAMLTVPANEREAYVEGCFRSLPQTARGRALLTAVSASLTYGRSGEAARVLHIHRHTLDYRLGRFAEVTGLDLNDPVTRFRCGIGLFLIGLMPMREEPQAVALPGSSAG